MSIVSYLRLFPREEYLEDFQHSLEVLLRLVREHKGFISVEVLHPTDNSTSYVIVSEWESEEDFKAWEHSPQHDAVKEDYDQNTGQGYTKMRLTRYR